MAKIVSPIFTRVEVIGKLKESNFQPGQYYRSVLFLDLSQPEGSDAAKIWKSLSEAECEGLTKGATVQLIPTGVTKEGVARHNIVLMDAQTPATAPTSTPAPTTGWSPEERRAIATKVQQHADLMAYCLETSRKRFDGLVEAEESFRALATTLFLSAVRESR